MQIMEKVTVEIRELGRMISALAGVRSYSNVDIKAVSDQSGNHGAELGSVVEIRAPEMKLAKEWDAEYDDIKIRDWDEFYALLADHVFRDRFPVSIIRQIGNQYMMKHMKITAVEFSETRLRTRLVLR